MKGIEVWRKSTKSTVQWSEMNCSDVRWNGAVGNLNKRIVKCSWVKFKLKEVKCRKCSEVKCSWAKCSEGLSNSLLLRWLFHLSDYFIFFWLHFYNFMYDCIFCTPLFNCVNYVFLLLCLCILIVMYVIFCVFCFIVLFCVLFLCKCIIYCCQRVSTQLK
jgi:hypothetical protein